MFFLPPPTDEDPPPRGVIFDFDGVIVNTEEAVYDAWREVFLAHGADLPLDLYRRCVGSDHGLWDPKVYFEEVTGLKPEWDPILHEKNRRTRELLAGMQTMPGILDTLAFLESRAIPMAVASSSSRSWVGGWLDRLGLVKYFHSWHCRDDVARVKPFPDLFLRAAAALRLHPSEILVIEDSANGLRAAHAANMRCLLIPNEITRGQVGPDTGP
ncbi:MAG: HAD family hydrolase [Verrucomicrobiales bacterium]